MKLLLLVFTLINGLAAAQNNQCFDVKFKDSIVDLYNHTHENLESRSISNEEKKRLKSLLNKIDQRTPCFNQMNFLVSEFDMKLYPKFKASLTENSTSLLIKLDIGASIVKSDTENGIRQFEQLLKRNEYSETTLQFYRDVLNSVPNNGFLITHSFEDTYCLWYLQHKKGVRNDVKLVSLQLLTSDKYRANIALKLSASKKVDIDFLGELLSSNEDKNISISSTVPKSYLNTHLERLFPVGLVFVYTKQDFNYFENNDLLKEFMPTIEDLIVMKNKRVMNYIPMIKVKSIVHKRQNEESAYVMMQDLITRIKKVCN